MEPDDILGELRDVFEAKNDDYSDTWIVSGMALAALHDEPVQLESAEDHIVNGNVHRLLDKVLRGYSAALLHDDINFEAAQDSFEDASVYSAMLASILADEQTERLPAAFTNARGGRYPAATDGGVVAHCDFTGKPLPETGTVTYEDPEMGTLTFADPMAFVQYLADDLEAESDAREAVEWLVETSAEDRNRRTKLAIEAYEESQANGDE